MHDTDVDWELFARNDPYFAVCTDPKFRRENWTEAARDAFFNTGYGHVNAVTSQLRQCFGAPDRFSTSLDFGCGVGRILIPLAALSETAIGVDVSPAMLAETRRNADERNIKNIVLYESDDDLSKLSHLRGTVTLLTSVIVLQHIPTDRGTRLLGLLLDLMAPNSFGCLQFTVASRMSNLVVETGPTTAVTHAFYQRLGRDGIVRLCAEPASDRGMQMNHYNLNEVFCLMLSRGITQAFWVATEHCGVIGVELFFQRKE